MEEHLFTLEEANALIPKLEILMVRVQQRAAEVRRGIEELATEIGKPPLELSASDIMELRPALQPAITELEQLVAEIESCGGQFKGVELGLVDFPAEINGEIGLLCWQFGEKEINYWHTLEDGFAGRQPLTSDRPLGSYLQ